MKDRVVVLGAGPAGISAAWRLAARGVPVTVIEKDSAVGGMGKTIKCRGVAVDFGPHTFHIRETEDSRRVIAEIQPFFGPDPLILTRGTRVLLHGKYYVYPLELSQILTGLHPALSLKILLDYAIATAGSLFRSPKQEDSFEEWGVRNLGKTLYDLCFGVYSERVWGMPTSQISSKQAQRVAKLNLKNIVLRMLGIRADPAAYFTKYMYPRAGISQLYDSMATEVVRNGGDVRLCQAAVRLERSGTSVRRVIVDAQGREDAIECAGVVSTLPLPRLATMMTPAMPDATLEHAARLRYRSMKLIYVILRRDRLTDFHWVYLSDRHFRCNRISEQKNVSRDMVPSGQTVLCIELSCWKGDELWGASDAELLAIAMEDLKKTGLGVTDGDVIDHFVLGIETAYPVYELNFESHLLPVLEAVHSFDNLVTVGRHGLFLNNSMDDNVMLGIQVADGIADHGFRPQRWYEEMSAFMQLRFEGK